MQGSRHKLFTWEVWEIIVRKQGRENKEGRASKGSAVRAIPWIPWENLEKWCKAQLWNYLIRGWESWCIYMPTLESPWMKAARERGALVSQDWPSGHRQSSLWETALTHRDADADAGSWASTRAKRDMESRGWGRDGVSIMRHKNAEVNQPCSCLGNTIQDTLACRGRSRR